MKIKIAILKNLRLLTIGKEWVIIVVIFIFFITIILAANIYFFLQISKNVNESTIQVIESPIVIFKKELFEQILDNLQKKEQYFNQGLLSEPAISDPSL